MLNRLTKHLIHFRAELLQTIDDSKSFKTKEKIKLFHVCEFDYLIKRLWS